jgi:hypothetical protein
MKDQHDEKMAILVRWFQRERCGLAVAIVQHVFSLMVLSVAENGSRDLMTGNGGSSPDGVELLA